MTRDEAKFKLEILVDWFGPSEVLSMLGDVLHFKAEQARAQSTTEIARSYARDAREVNKLFERMEN